MATGEKYLLVLGTQTYLFGGIPMTYGMGVTAILFAITWAALAKTAWGRHVYAIGDAPESARLTGINVRVNLVSVYVVAGIIYGFAAWIAMGRTPTADPNAYQTGNLDSITAVVIGGTSLFGGRGVVLGSLIGAFIVQVFDNGLALAGYDPNYQVLAVGLLVIAAVSVDQWIRSVRA